MKLYKRILGCLLFAAIFTFSIKSAEAEQYIVEDGKANAEIVVSRNPERPRMAGLAALELQHYIEQMSGARLPIVTSETEEYPVKIYVGESERTKELGINTDDLKYSAFHLDTGDHWLALIGKDIDFAPREPWTRSRNDKERAVAAWDEKVGDRTDAAWGYRGFGGSRWNSRNYSQIMSEKYGKDNKHIWNPNDKTYSNEYLGSGMGNGFWRYDSGGSLNAVYQFLRDLGVRWYLPGEIGEVVPEVKSISLPQKSRTVRPDFPVREWLGSRPKDFDGVMWRRRIGIEGSFEVLGYGGTHGLGNVLVRKEMKQKHPEYYALINGKRITAADSGGVGEPCFSSEGLVNEAVKYVTFRFGEYGENMVQLSPPDGLRECQCEDCRGKSASELVFGFLNTVAKQLDKKYPNKILLGAAYTPYREPPASIDKFSPNFALSINNRGRPCFTNPEYFRDYWASVEAWRKKVGPRRILRVDNNLYESRKPMGFPRMHPRGMAKDLKALKGISLGDRNEISLGKPNLLRNPGSSHITLYVNARYLWDADQDIEALLDEYVRKFYGPAAAKMKEVFTYAELGLYEKTRKSKIDLKNGIKLLELLHEGRDIAGESIYGKRIQLIIDEFYPLETLKQKLAVKKERGDVPSFEYWRLTGKYIIDGKLEEKSWRRMKKINEINVQNKKTGEALTTAFQVLVDDKEIRIGIRCEENTKTPLNSTTDKNDDVAMLDGDHLELLIETDYNNYYRIAVNPAGAVLDIDMAEGKGRGIKWDSNAEVAVYIGDGFWSAEVSIPTTTANEGAMDPLHHIIYRKKPTGQWPWYFNIIRVRAREDGARRWAYSFDDKGDCYNHLYFGKLARK